MEEPSSSVVVQTAADAHGARRVIGRVVSSLPLPMAVFVARWLLGATRVARVIRYMEGPRIQQLARGFSGPFLARIAVAMTADEREYAMPHVPFEAVLAATRPLLARNAFDISALYAGTLTPAHLRQLALQIEDPVAIAGLARESTPEVAAEMLTGLSPQRAANVVTVLVADGFGVRWIALAAHVPEKRLAALLRALPEDAVALLRQAPAAQANRAPASHADAESADPESTDPESKGEASKR